MKTTSPGAAGYWLTWLVRIEQGVSAGLLVLVLVTMASQVVARYVLRSPLSWSEELARLGMIWLAFIAGSFVMAEGRHLTVDVLSARLGPAGRLRLEWISNVAVMATCLLLLFGGLPFVWRVAPVGSPALGIPMSWWYGAASVGLSLMALHSGLNLLVALRTGRPVWDAQPVVDEQDLPIRTKGLE
jgi:TRAP-type transport system small permease protein